jgi:RNA-directed DNA polymerase
MIERSRDFILDWRAYWDERVQRRKTLLDAYEQYLERLLRDGFPPIFEMHHFSELVGIQESLIARMIANSNDFYRSFRLPKKSGGEREISVPSPVLLHTQRWILRNIVSIIKVHPCCYGFVSNKSAIKNAEQHLRQKSVLKLDLVDFFPSIKLRSGISIFRRIGYTPRVSYCLAHLCFRNGELPQGGATSPAISNIVGKRLDSRLYALALKSGLIYTRYADDMTFSGEEITWRFVSAVEKIVVDEGFQVNRKKTRLIKSNQTKIITGVSIGSGEAKLPRKTVREIKKEAYFVLKNGLDQHAKKTDNYDPMIVERLIGRLNFWLQVEPSNRAARQYYELLKEYQRYLDTYGLGSTPREPDGLRPPSPSP